MTPDEAEERLRSRVAAAGKLESELTPIDMLDVFIDFYRDVRCEGCDPDEDADMLLFQCGVSDWGEGAHFEVEFVRQFSINDEDGEYDHMEQLRYTFYYSPDVAAGQNVEFKLWSSDCVDLDEFRKRVAATTGYEIGFRERPTRRVLRQHGV